MAELDRILGEAQETHRLMQEAAKSPGDRAVRDIVRLCNGARIFLVPRGRGTGTTGATVPVRGGLVLSLERMDRILRFEPDDRIMVVEPGVTNQAVQDTARSAGFFWPPDPTSAAYCTVGGNLAYNSAGPRAVKYGTPRENVLGLEVVLADGTIWEGLRALRKDNTGIDLKHLFIGAEGTLGIITAAALKLHPLPTQHALAWFAPRDPAAAQQILGMFQNACGSRLSAFEIMNRHQLDLVLANVPNRRNPLAG